jgi:hypothetical protein
MRMRVRPTSKNSVIVLGLLLLGMTFTVGSVAPSGSAAVPVSSGSHALASASSPTPTNNGALTANGSGPNAAEDSAYKITIAYHVQFANVTYPQGPYSVAIPGLVALLPTTTGELHIYLPPSNFTSPSRTGESPYTSDSLRVPSGTDFTTSAPATLSSSGLALMASWPYGNGSIEVQWQWIATFGDGSQQTGALSPWQYVEPTQIALIEGYPPTSLPAGSNYELCLGGPIAGRTFSVHFTSTQPVQTYNGPQVTIPLSESGTYCWNSTIPSPLAPQSLSIHLWEYGKLTFLVYETSVAIGNGQTSTSPPGTTLPAALPTWFAPTLVVGIAICIGLAVWLVSSRRPAAPPKSPPTN